MQIKLLNDVFGIVPKISERFSLKLKLLLAFCILDLGCFGVLVLFGVDGCSNKNVTSFFLCFVVGVFNIDFMGVLSPLISFLISLSISSFFYSNSTKNQELELFHNPNSEAFFFA